MTVLIMTNLKASIKYQLADNRISVLIYYMIIVAICLLTGLTMVLSPFASADNSAMMMGISSATAIFAFVASLCSFKENFGMLLQNGVSRRCLFTGRLCTAAALSAVMAVVDEVITLAIAGLGVATGKWTSASLFDTLFLRDTNLVMNPVLQSLASIAFSFFLILAFCGLGYFVTVLFYRLGRIGKIAVGAGVPVLWTVVLPALALLDQRVTGGRVTQAVLEVVRAVVLFAFGQPQNAIATLLVIFALFSAFAWLLIRRATIRK